MSHSTTIHPTTPDPRDRPAAAARREARFVFVEHGASDPQSGGDLRELLHRRLSAISLIVLAAVVVGVPVAMGSLWPESRRDWTILLTASPQLVVSIAIVGLLRRRRSLSLTSLRLCELLLFGSAWGVLATIILTGLANDVLPASLERGTLGFLAGSVGVGWICLIVAYGVFIPNSGRRCAAVVTAMAVTPVALFAAGAAQHGLWGQPAVRPFLLELAFWLGTAAVLAIYGSHRIEILRREAVDARRLGQYRLLELLGSGGMGEVYLAEHTLLRRPCAVKLIRPDRYGGPSELLRFEREVQTTAALTHPNTVQIFDYGHAADGTFYYVMEHLPGMTLEEMVGRFGPLPASRAVHFLAQVCGALREAHAAGLVHRDLKPGNIMICQRGGVHDVAKLLDFGLVRTLEVGGDSDRLTQEGAITGTPAYMSPEQVAGRSDLDSRSDIYSLGCVVRFLLTGEPPFAGRSPIQVLAAHLHESPAPPGSQFAVPGNLQEVLRRCLCKEPKDRFPDVESLAAAVGRCQLGEWTPAMAAQWWERHGGADQGQPKREEFAARAAERTAASAEGAS